MEEFVYQAGRQVYPAVTLPMETLGQRVRNLELRGPKLTERAADLFLASACAAGDPRAMEYFESQFLSRLEGYLARFALAHDVVDEIRQGLRLKLFVGTPPGIASYRGQGPLGAWVRVTAVRAAIDAIRASPVPANWPSTELLDLAIAPADGPESVVSKRLYRERFRAALDGAMRGLEKRERTLLRLLVLDGLNMAEIGVVYRVHRATVTRWFVAMRANILASIRKELGVSQPLSPSELRSIVGLLEDDVGLSARRILNSEPRA